MQANLEKRWGGKFSAFFRAESFERAPGDVLTAIGEIALIVFALFWLIKIDISQAAEGLLIVVFLWAFAKGSYPRLRNDPLILIVLGWMGYQFIFIPWVASQYPDLSGKQIDYAQHYAKIALVPVVAWWFGGSVNRIALVLGLAVLGFILGATFQDGGLLDSLDAIKNQQRLVLGYRNGEHASVYAALTLLVILCLGRRIARLFGRWHWAGYLLVVLAGLYSFALVILTQTRATWLGLLIAMTVAGSLWFFAGKKTNGVPARYRAGIFLLFLAGVCAAGWGIKTLDADTVVVNRVVEEKDVIAKVVGSRGEDIPLTSIGIRLILWKQGLEWFSQRPLFGWGPKTREYLFNRGEVPEIIQKEWGIFHFHNQALELAIAYGIIGLAVFGTIAWLVIRAGWCAWRDGRLPLDIMLFGTGFLAYWIVVNSFESYLNYSTGYYVHALIGGAFYSFHFSRHKP